MIDLEVLQQRDIEARVHRTLAHVRRKRRKRSDRVDGNGARLVVRTLESLGDAGCEDRKVVQKERIEVVGIEDDDGIGVRRLERLAHLCEELSGR